jgi:hypothetical protein
VNDDDVRVHEARGGLRLAMKAIAPLVIAGSHDLERDVAIEHGVVRAEDFSHRTVADPIQELILPNALHGLLLSERSAAV